jgi:hypothetical protein
LALTVSLNLDTGKVRTPLHEPRMVSSIETVSTAPYTNSVSIDSYAFGFIKPGTSRIPQTWHI